VGGNVVEYQCWFCGKGVERTDEGAIVIAVRNLWSSSEDDPTQYLYVHSLCAAEKMMGSAMAFDPRDLLNSN
jgi:hypothetical protein